MKFISLILAAAMLFTLAGCTKAPAPPATEPDVTTAEATAEASTEATTEEEVTATTEAETEEVTTATTTTEATTEATAAEAATEATTTTAEATTTAVTTTKVTTEKATATEATATEKEEEKPTEYVYIVYSSEGSDSGKGTVKSPYKTAEQARAHKLESHQIGVVVEYYMTVNCKIKDTSKVEGLDGVDTTLTEFSGKSEGLFNGSTAYNGSLITKTEDGKTFYSARYTLTGRDANGNNGKMFIEDNGYDPEALTPFVVSEGGNIGSWGSQSLRSVYTETEDGFKIDLFKLYKDDGRKTKTPKDPDDTGSYTYVFYSPKTGKATADGSQYNPVETKKQAEKLAKNKSGNIQILEFIMAVDVITQGGTGVGGINPIPFQCESYGEYFNGKSKVIGCDTQKWGYNATPFSARYMLEGKDFKGEECSIYIENSGSALEKCVPYITTDSKALNDLIDGRTLRTIVVPGGRGVTVWVYAIDK